MHYNVNVISALYILTKVFHFISALFIYYCVLYKCIISVIIKPSNKEPEENKMANIKIENGKIYREHFGRTDVFEIVGRIPQNFFVWNIGENMGTHEYIPLCEDLHPENKDDYSIKSTTLKAVRVTPEEWGKLNDAASVGVNNLEAAVKALKSKRHGYWSDRKRAAAELVIDIFEKIS